MVVSGRPFDSEGYTRLVGEHSPWMLALARKYAQGPVEASDIVQEVWARLLEEAEAPPPAEEVRRWLRSRVREVGSGWRKKAQRRGALIARFGLSHSDRTVRPPDPGPVQVREEMRAAIAQLPRSQRRVVTLFMLEGLTIRETAERLDLSEGAVKSSLYRGVARVRERVGNERLYLWAEMLTPEAD